MTGDDEDATKVETTLPRSRSRSRSATKSRLKPGPSILEVLNCKKDIDKNKPVVKEIFMVKVLFLTPVMEIKLSFSTYTCDNRAFIMG